MTDQLLVKNLTVKNATRTMVNKVSIEVSKGQIVALLGPNGAGKSELVLGIAGMLPSTGEISIGIQQLQGSGVEAIRAAGIAAVPEGHQVLSRMSVIDNLRASGPMLSAAELSVQIDQVFEIFPELVKLTSNQAGSMSGGQQQMLAIAQALISRPQFLLIDEMSLGLAPIIIDRLVGVIQTLREQQVGILLIEQFTQLALGLADHCYVMAQGEIHYSGSTKKLREQPKILENAYLGSDSAVS